MSLTDDEKRKIGGSDVPALVGYSKKKPIDIFGRIVEGREEPDNKLFRRGRLMEPVVRVCAAEDYGLTLLGPRKLTDPRRPYVRASLDDVHAGPEGEEPVEFKSIETWAATEYGPGGTDLVARAHMCQLQFYLAESKAPRGRLYALIGLDDLREYVIPADLELQAMLFEAVDRFYVDHIKTGRPPPPDASDAYAEWLQSHMAKTDKLAEATATDMEWAMRFDEARAARKLAEEKQDEARNHLLRTMVDAGAVGLVGPGLKATNKMTIGQPRVDWEAVCAEAKVPKAVVERHTKRNPYPVFLLKLKD